MATSKIQICNSALAKLGVNKIQSFSETSKAAVLCDLQYDKIRKKLLRSHLWDFAIKRAAIAKLATTPLFDYDAEFQLPSDCLRVITTHAGDDFVIEGKKLLLNNSSCNLKYISDIEDVSYFDTTFEEALSYMLAADMAYPLKQSITLKQEMLASAKEELADARSFDAQNGRIQQTLQEDYFLNSRISGVDNY